MDIEKSAIALAFFKARIGKSWKKKRPCCLPFFFGLFDVLF